MSKTTTYHRADGTDVSDERKPAEPGTAVMAALPAAAAAGSAAGVAASGLLKRAEPWWLKITAQATWGTIGAVFLFLFWQTIQDSRRQDLEDRREERDYQRTEAAKTTNGIITELRELRSDIRSAKGTSESMTSELRSAVAEMRASRIAIETWVRKLPMPPPNPSVTGGPDELPPPNEPPP